MCCHGQRAAADYARASFDVAAAPAGSPMHTAVRYRRARELSLARAALELLPSRGAGAGLTEVGTFFFFFFFSKESMPRCQSPKLLCIIYEDFHSRRASTKLPHGLRNASVVCSTSARTTPRNALSDDETTPALSRYLRGVRLGACEAQAAGHLPSGEGADKSAFQRRFLALLTEAAAPHSERR